MAEIGQELFTQTDYAQEEYDIIEEEIDEVDRQRFKEKMAPDEGAYKVDTNKFAQTKRYARLYRANGTLALVPFVQASRYLRKRNRVTGARIFFSKPPVDPPTANSDPCPVDTGEGLCGRRMSNQFELIKHMMRKHSDVAPFYLNQKQIDAAKGLVSYNPGEGISSEPSTPPEAIVTTEGIDIGPQEPVVTIKTKK
mgnify:CR=1 FL=1